MNLYETTFIADAQLKEDGWESLIDKYSGIINQNGSIKQLDRWGVRRLAYEINKQTHGYYVHIIHESAPSVPRELERQFQLDELCMRHLTVVADNPKYIEEMNKAKARQAAAEEASSHAETTPAVSADVEPERPSGESKVEEPKSAADGDTGDGDTEEKS